MPKRQPVVDIKIQQKVRDAIVEICKKEAEDLMSEMLGKQNLDREIANSLDSDKFFTNSNRGSNQFKVQATMEFGFKNNEYADALENGAKATPFTGTFTQHVGEHTRELGKPKTRTQKIAKALKLKKKRSTTVKKHTRTYKNMKPVKLASGEWRILKGTPAQKKQAPLHKGIMKLLKNESLLATRLKQFIS
jgi:hypothetical protein